MAGDTRFELVLLPSKGSVLPLHQSPMEHGARFELANNSFAGCPLKPLGYPCMEERVVIETNGRVAPAHRLAGESKTFLVLFPYWYSHPELNWKLRIRSALFYPLNYGSMEEPQRIELCRVLSLDGFQIRSSPLTSAPWSG